MQKKVLFSLGLIAIMGLTVSQAMANSTIYTDELGRMHFLGKDPGAKTLQKVEDYSNPATKDVTNAVYNASNVESTAESKVNSTIEDVTEEVAPEVEPKRKGFFSSRRDSASIKYGSSGLDDATKFKEVDQKTFWLW